MKDLDLNHCLGVGVAGNTADHLKEAGEVSGDTPKSVMPKEIFLFYAPGSEGHFLNTNPYTHDELFIPNIEDKIQIEPEIGVLCDLVVKDHKLISIKPIAFCAFNDCSIRTQRLPTFSAKKNWGIKSKGISRDYISLDTFSEGGVLDKYQLVSYLKRDGVIEPYSVNSSVKDFLLFHDPLMNWTIEKLNQDYFSKNDPLTNKSDKDRNFKALVATGCPKYTKFGLDTSIKAGDEIYVIIYNRDLFSEKEIIENLDSEKLKSHSEISYLKQNVSSM